MSPGATFMCFVSILVIQSAQCRSTTYSGRIYTYTVYPDRNRLLPIIRDLHAIDDFLSMVLIPCCLSLLFSLLLGVWPHSVSKTGNIPPPPPGADSHNWHSKCLVLVPVPAFVYYVSPLIYP